MPLTNEEQKSILHNNPIEGVDFIDGLNRFNGQVGIYMRIIRSFVNNTPKTLELLAALDIQNPEDYTVRVHGLKGSCYGISAIAQGDLAKTLEFASKDSDWEKVERDTPKLIESVNKLIADLDDLIRMIDTNAEASKDKRPIVDAPDKEVIQSLLEATKCFDIDAIRSSIDELDKAVYSFDPKLVIDLNQNLMNFRYDLIEDKANELLSSY